MDICYGFLGVGAVLLVVMLLGHGMWLVLAALFRAISPATPGEARKAAGREPELAECVGCGSRLMSWESACPECGLRSDGGRARQAREIDTARRQVVALRGRNELDSATAERVVKLLFQRRQEVLGLASIEPPTQPPLREAIEDALPVSLVEEQDAVAVPAMPTPPPPPFRPRPPLVTEPPVPAPPAPPATPRTPLRGMLTAFMEERNILWGELVGGLLIVGCSIALVLTLWGQIERLPYFPFLLFALLTGALFGAGQYTLHHWKLASTSRGLLVIALLLVPLDLLVLAGPAGRGEHGLGAGVDWAMAGAALLLGTLLVRTAGRDLIGTDTLPGPVDRRWLLALAVVGPAATQLFVPQRLDEAAAVAGWSWAPLGAYLLACGAVLGGVGLYGRREADRLEAPQATALFSFLGVAAFSLLGALAYLMTRLEAPIEALHALALPVLLAGVPAMAAGLLVYRRLEAPEQAPLRTAGTAIALGGAAAMFAGIALAWPDAWPLLGTLVFAAATLLAGAALARAAWLHAAALPAVALAALVGHQLVTGGLVGGEDAGQVLRALTSASSGVVLGALSLGLAVLAVALNWPASRDHARALGIGGLAVGAVALGVATGHGPEAPFSAAAAHALAGLAALVLVWWPREEGASAALPVWLAHVGASVLLTGSLWLMHAARPGELAVWGLVAGLEALGLAWAALALRGPAVWARAYGAASAGLGLLAGALALGLALLSRTFPTDYVHTGTVLAVAGGALAWALRGPSRGWFVAFQVGVTAGALCAVTAGIAGEAWLRESVAGFLDPRALQLYGLAVAGLGLVWVAARQALSDRPPWGALWPREAHGVEHLSLALVVVGQLTLAGLGCLPGVQSEWSGPPTDAVTRALEVAHGPLAWALLGALALPLGLMLRAGSPDKHRLSVGLLTLLYLTAPVLYVGRYTGDLAVASALRWALAVAFLAGSAVVWRRVPLVATWQTYGLLAGAAVAVVALTTVLAGIGFSGVPTPGPVEQSVFAKMGRTVSSIGPLMLLIVALVGTAGRERSPGYALAAGLLATVSVMGGYALGIVTSGGELGEAEQVRMVLLGCATASAAGLAWLGGRGTVGGGPLLGVQAWLGLGGLALVALLAAGELLFRIVPEGAPRFAVLGGWLGWGALAVSVGAASLHAWLFPAGRAHAAGLAGAVAGLLIGSYAQGWDSVDRWASYHALAGAWVALALAVSVAGSLRPRGGSYQLFPSAAGQVWLSALVLVLVGLAIRGAGVEAAGRVTPMLAITTASALLGAVAWWSRRGLFAHASGLVFVLGGWLAAQVWGPPLGNEDVVLWAALALALAGAFWHVAEWGEAWMRWPAVPFTHVAGPVALGLLAGHVTVTFLEPVREQPTWRAMWLSWATVAGVGACLAASLRDDRRHVGRPALYLLGVVTVGVFLHALNVSNELLPVGGAIGLAAHTLLASGVMLLAFRGRDGGGERSALEGWRWGWFLPAQTVVSLAVVMLALLCALGQQELTHRLAGPLSVGLLAGAAALLVPLAGADRREGLLRNAAGLTVVALGLVTWALPPLDTEAIWLHRNAWLFVVLAGCAALGLEGSLRWRGGRVVGVVVGALAAALLPVLLLQMFPWFDPVTRRTPLDRIVVACVALATVGLLALALRLALDREGGPWGWPEKGRIWLVYGAEALLVLLFIHVRLNVPEVFLGVLARYWTLLVMLVAFCGVGLGELFERRGLRVLAVPLQRTGSLLPLIPLLVFWAWPPAALLAFADKQAPGLGPMLGYLDRIPRDFNSYALLWALAGGLYAVMAVTRRSFVWALTAALAGNFALWALYAHFGLGFLVHPQAWLIPLALIILGAAQINRDRLSPGALEGLRYLGVSMIYVASTADLFLVGLGNSVWLPVLLAALAVAGVLVGIQMRVKAFLFLGVAFLLVDVLCMIWHAAVNRQQTWLWWASGIVLGAMILALFAVFEKRRNDVLRLVEQIKTWE